jgi:hypothetical protein
VELRGSGLVTTGFTLPPSARRLEILGAIRGLPISCEHTGDAPHITLVAPRDDSAPVEFELKLPVVNVRLEGPRGRVTVGNRVVDLGGGSSLTPRQDDAFLLERVRWVLGSQPSVSVAIRGDSDDLKMGKDQLVPSKLAIFAQEPRWTAIAAVLSVVLAAIVGKLFELAIPTKS